MEQMDLFTCDPETSEDPEPCWRMQMYGLCTERVALDNNTDYGRWIGMRWFEFYQQHPERARRTGETEHQWFPRMCENQDPFDDWLRAQIDAGERPTARLPKPPAATRRLPAAQRPERAP